MPKQICDYNLCTGCGMCSNVCPTNSILMKKDIHGFSHPVIGENCIGCMLCQKKCPVNNQLFFEEKEQLVYAAWTSDKRMRKQSTSGGVFSELAKEMIKRNGVVVGVQWSSSFTPEHVVVDKIKDIDKLQGSKYAQSDTGTIFAQVRDFLEEGIDVLFSGTPCQNAALKVFLGKKYTNLYTVDFVCHGVPAESFLLKYYSELHSSLVSDVQLRHKDKYWDYSYVKIEYVDGFKYKALTIDDDYFNLFNIGYSLRESCHNCRYASSRRVSDITLADFWGYTPNSYKARNYNKGTSCVIVNSKQGNELFNCIKENLYYEVSSMEKAMKGNRCLSESFVIDEKRKEAYWNDYENGFTVHELNQKYAANTFKLPSLLWVRRLYKKFKWVIKK